MTKRNYEREYQYHGTPEQIKNRASRNAARAQTKQTHGAAAVRGKDVSHVNNRPRDNRPENLKLESPSKNRARKGK